MRRPRPWRCGTVASALTALPSAFTTAAGVNNLLRDEAPPAARLEWLVQWAKLAWPGSRVGVVALTPYSNGPRWQHTELVAPTNAQYQQLVARQGVRFIDCSKVGAGGQGRHAPCAACREGNCSQCVQLPA